MDNVWAMVIVWREDNQNSSGRAVLCTTVVQNDVQMKYMSRLLHQIDWSTQIG